MSTSTMKAQKCITLSLVGCSMVLMCSSSPYSITLRGHMKTLIGTVYAIQSMQIKACWLSDMNRCSSLVPRPPQAFIACSMKSGKAWEILRCTWRHVDTRWTQEGCVRGQGSTTIADIDRYISSCRQATRVRQGTVECWRVAPVTVQVERGTAEGWLKNKR